MELDVLIFGGGAAGLWLLDDLSRRGDRVLLLESGRLGQGQTIASQGIIHGGLKYTLSGLLTPAAREIRGMPGIWRDCLAGRRTPDLRHTRLRSPTCYLWRSQSLRSRLGMLGARIGLHVAPTELAADERPALFAGCPGPVARLDEQVISPASFIADLARQHRARILRINSDPHIDVSAQGTVRRVILWHPETGKPLELSPREVVLAAGAGNAALRRRCGLASEEMQRRPLQMVLVRGTLPMICGHCVDGARTRVTITADGETQGTTVWQVGGQIAEEGVGLDAERLICRAREELTIVLPGVDLSDCEWATYRVDRAERAMPRGGQPETATVLSEANVITVWPTKLALAPQAAQMVAAHLPQPAAIPADHEMFSAPALEGWPRPEVAPPPWETVEKWSSLAPNRQSRRAA